MSKNKQSQVRLIHTTPVKSYHEIRDCYVFRHQDKNGHVRLYAKVTNSTALDLRTDKDKIFLPTDMVEPLYPVCCSLIGV